MRRGFATANGRRRFGEAILVVAEPNRGLNVDEEWGITMTDHTQSGWLLERPDGPHGNFEVVFGCPPVDVGTPVGRGLGHYYNDNGARSPTDVLWQEAERFDP